MPWLDQATHNQRQGRFQIHHAKRRLVQFLQLLLRSSRRVTTGDDIDGAIG